MQDKTYINRCEKDINPDQETITLNKSELIKDNIQLLVMGILTGIIIGATIVQWIIYFS